jgi:hypothetical protein
LLTVTKRSQLLAAALALPLLVAADAKDPLNGFEIERHTVPRETIRAGGPGRDPLPEAKAEYVAAADASWVEPQTPVIGLFVGGQARAYPVHLMEYHQLVSDELGGVPVVVAYDPLTGTPRAFRRDVDGRTLRFGISGLVYNSNFLLYDRETESLWSQFRGDAISGELAGKKLARLPVRQETLARWLERHPETRVLVRPRPKEIDYRYSPYKAYWLEDQIPYPVLAQDPRFHAKEIVLGVEVNGKSRAYLGSLLTRADHRAEDEFEGRKIRIVYDPDAAVFVWEAPDDVAVTDAYWFAWKAFHPDTGVWHDPGPPVKPD